MRRTRPVTTGVHISTGPRLAGQQKRGANIIRAATVRERLIGDSATAARHRIESALGGRHQLTLLERWQGGVRPLVFFRAGWPPVARPCCAAERIIGARDLSCAAGRTHPARLLGQRAIANEAVRFAHRFLTVAALISFCSLTIAVLILPIDKLVAIQCCAQTCARGCNGTAALPASPRLTRSCRRLSEPEPPRVTAGVDR